MIPIRYNLRSLAVRKTTTFATAFGIALVVFVLSAALMLSAGIERTLAHSGKADIAVVTRNGSDNELGSSVDVAQVNTVLAAPGVKRDGSGQPSGVGEVILVASLEKLGTDGISNVQLRGVPGNVLSFRPDIKVIDGRPPRPGSDEVMIGRRIRGRFKGTDLDQTIELRKNRPVKVVGVFESSAPSYESEIWVDIDALRGAFSREGIVSSVRVRLESRDSFDVYKTAVESEKQLGFQVQRETDYFEKQSEGTAQFVGALGGIISVFFALGAMIGAMITMYAAVANRQREVGTLRALGFSRRSILLSFLTESVVLSLLGGVVGLAAATLMGFVKFSMMNFSTWSEVVFTFDPTPRVLLTALLFAGGMGVLGGFFPAVRAARVSPITAMRG